MADRDEGLSPDLQGLKAATKALVRAAGGQEACATLARYGRHQSYSEFASVEHPQRFMPIDVVAALEDVTHGIAGHPIVTRHLCRMAGGVFVRVPQGQPGEAAFLDALSRLTGEFGRLSTGLMDALRDRTVTRGEVIDGELLAKCDELATHAMQMRALLERVIGEG